MGSQLDIFQRQEAIASIVSEERLTLVFEIDQSNMVQGYKGIIISPSLRKAAAYRMPPRERESIS